MASTITETDICNSALVKLGVKTLSSLSDNTKEGRLCALRYARIRDELLRSHPWNWAKKRLQLAVSTVVPTFFWEYQFPMPSDFMRLLETDLDEDANWVMEGNMFLSHSNTLNILYIFRQTDTTQYDDLFVNAMSWRLAAELSYSLTQSSALGKNCYDAYADTLKHARSVNAQERGAIQQVVADDWSQARVTQGTFGFGRDPSKL